MTDLQKRLIDTAQKARLNAHAKYSKFKVGAALLTADGQIFTGCNIESSSYGLTICAERVALFKALSEGADDFTHLAVATGIDPPGSLCGACRQLLWDYARKIEIMLAGENSQVEVTSLKALLPRPFGDEDI